MNQTLDEDEMFLRGPSESGPSNEDANEDTLLRSDGKFKSGQHCQRKGKNSIPT